MRQPMAMARDITDDSSEPDMTVVHEAAVWLAHFESGDVSPEDQAAFNVWRSADTAHALAFERLNTVRDRLDHKPDLERETFRRLLSRPRRRAGTPLLVLLVLAGAGWITMRLPVVQTYLADERTITGETRALDLADGSHLTLATASAINTDIDAATRTVTLLRGEVFARVVKQGGAAFVVRTEDGVATALGTAFTVRKEADATVVAVAESQVQVCPEQSDAQSCLTLQPGQTARISAGRVRRLGDTAAADVGAWTEGWLPVDNRPVVEVLDELNRWRATPIAFDRSELADLRVSGVFALRDPEKAADNLTQLLPLVLDRSDPSAPVMRRR